MAQQPSIIASKVSYRGKTFTVLEENVRMPNGRSFWHEVVQKRDAVGIIALDERGRIFFTREFRTGLGTKTIKLPGGAVEHGETPRQAAARELAEETGYRPIGLRLIYKASGGATTRWNRYYFAADRVVPDTTHQADADEDIEVLRVSLKQAVAMAWRGDLYQGDIMYAILRYAKLKRKL